MLKRILIPLEEYDYSKTAIDYAVHLAENSRCHLSGLFILDIPSIEKSIGPVPAGGTYYALKEEEQRTAEEKKKADELKNEFTTICNEKKIPYKIIIKEGNPEEIIIDESKYHDLVIIGEESSFRYGEEKDKNLQHQIISQGICPVLLIPKVYRDIKDVLLCYDDSLQAIKTIHEFFHFGIWKQRQVILLNVNDDADLGEKLLNKMGEYLNTWNVSFEKVCLDGHPKEVILNYVHKRDVDMVVLGAYGKKNIMNFFFGSTTDELLRNVDRPLFIYH